MNINELTHYKVIETDTYIAIVPRDARVKDANNLIIASLRTCCEYLARYSEYRLRGKDIPEAHELALRGANVISNVKN